MERFTEEDVLKKNNTFYDAFAEQFDKIPFDELITGYFKKYAPLTSGKKALDIGSGSGKLAEWIEKCGFSVLCVEPSTRMCQICSSKGLVVINSPIENAKVKGTFDHIFALSSLIHLLPERLPEVLRKIEGLLADSGIFYSSFLLGDKCGMDDPTRAGKKRYFSRFRKDEIIEMTTPLFSLLESVEVPVKRMGERFLIQVMQKRDKNNRSLAT